MSTNIKNTTETAIGYEPVLAVVFEQEVPQGSHNFELGYNKYEKVQTLGYNVSQNYGGTFGYSFGGTQRWSEDVDLPKGKWEIVDTSKECKVMLKRGRINYR